MTHYTQIESKEHDLEALSLKKKSIYSLQSVIIVFNLCNDIFTVHLCFLMDTKRVN